LFSGALNGLLFFLLAFDSVVGSIAVFLILINVIICSGQRQSGLVTLRLTKFWRDSISFFTNLANYFHTTN